MESLFGIWDCIVMFTLILISVVLGLYFRCTGGKQKSNEEYLLGGKNLSILPVAVSLMASFISAITLLGVSAENYYRGLIFVVIDLSYGLGTPIVNNLYLPVFFTLRKMSTYEYLELRFGSALRTIASLTYTIQMLLYNGVVLYAPAIVLEVITGLDRLISVMLVGLACTLYSSLGGMKSVVYTDLLQSLVMFVALLSVIIFASVKVGGITEVLKIAKEDGRLNFDNFSLDPTERHTWFSLMIGGLINYLSLYGVNHTQVQRLLSVSSVSRARRCVWWSWPALAVLSLATCLSGLAIYAVYRTCDPLKAHYITKPDQLMAYFVVDSMREAPGLLGLFVAGIFSASLSTVSAACNSLAAVIVTDYIDRWCKLKEGTVPWITKLAACGAGLVCVGLAFAADRVGAGGLLQAAITIFGAVGGPMLAVFTLGMFTTIANERGASIGLVSGLCVTLWLGLGAPRPAPAPLPLSIAGCGNMTLSSPSVKPVTQYFYLHRISYLWISPIGFLWTLCVGALISALWLQPQPWELKGLSHPDPALFTPPLAKVIKRRFKIKETSEN